MPYYTLRLPTQAGIDMALTETAPPSPWERAEHLAPCSRKPAPTSWCASCGALLDADSPSEDFCDDGCQRRWHLDRVAVATSAGGEV